MLRALGDAFVRGVDPASSLAARGAETQASLSGRPHGMLMAELLERGQGERFRRLHVVFAPAEDVEDPYARRIAQQGHSLTHQFNDLRRQWMR